MNRNQVENSKNGEDEHFVLRRVKVSSNGIDIFGNVYYPESGRTNRA